MDTLTVMLSESGGNSKSISPGVLAKLVKEVETMRQTSGLPSKMEFPLPPLVAELKNTDDKKTEESEIAAVLPNDFSKNSVTEPKTAKDTVRVSTAKLDSLLRQAEEFISVKATMAYFIHELESNHQHDRHTLFKELDLFYGSMSRMIDDLLYDIRTTLMHPFSSLLSVVPKIVRDLGQEFHKEIKTTIKGGEIEIDGRILEEMKDPLIHLIRNCVDHGIETPMVRRQQGKPESGSLNIHVKLESGKNVELVIEDDGAGIDTSKVIAAAIKSGIVSSDLAAAMTDKEVFQLILKSGISTSPFITDISGRGLGMAIVAEKIAKLGGNIEVDSTPGKGTRFTILLPVTLATFKGILVRLGAQFFIIPTNSVERAIRIRQHDIKSVESKQMILLNNESVALVRLGDLLGVTVRKASKNDEHPIPVLIISMSGKRIAFMVDEVLDEQEGLVKELGSPLIHVKNIAGVTISGSGMVVPILHVGELMDEAIHAAAKLEIMDLAGEEAKEQLSQQVILIAEDSITSRSLLRNILESAGYMVKTAVDGFEAFQLMQKESFDLVVSDVEMPRMNGFELTARIREHGEMAEIPVILVTALDTADDRKKGMDAGANAYIVKSDFEQSNLVDTVHRLI
jgi:two-component system chemotaxis sensor kinase CheA